MPSTREKRTTQQRARRANRDPTESANQRQARREQYANRDPIEAANARINRNRNDRERYTLARTQINESEYFSNHMTCNTSLYQSF